jgi:transposase-like protein
MRAVDSGSTIAEVARKHQLSPKLIERWRGEWRAKGEAAFPGIGRRGAEQAALSDAARIAELERKIGQLTLQAIAEASDISQHPPESRAEGCFAVRG